MDKVLEGSYPLWAKVKHPWNKNTGIIFTYVLISSKYIFMCYVFSWIKSYLQSVECPTHTYKKVFTFLNHSFENILPSLRKVKEKVI